jgi:hypothetical protein
MARLLVGSIFALLIVGTSTAAIWYILQPVVQLEPANFIGAEPPFVPEEVSPPAPPPSTQRVVPAAASVVSGDTPGLYGVTRTDECNVAGIERYLTAHADRGQAWARAQGIDPGDIHRVLTSLTPVTLRTDTAVTNHGFKNGRSTQFQSVLQAGTAVLVDVRGVPRVRCYCGNPLLRPQQPQSVRYEGPTWTDFSTRSVTVIKKAPAPVVEFVVVDRDTQKVVSRPRATSGDKDRDADSVITENVKDKPIGEGTASGSDASTGGGQSSNGPSAGESVDPTGDSHEVAAAGSSDPSADPSDPAESPVEPGAVTGPGAVSDSAPPDLDAFVKNCEHEVHEWRKGNVNYPTHYEVNLDESFTYQAIVDVGNTPVAPEAALPGQPSPQSKPVAVKCNVAARLIAIDDKLEVSESHWVPRSFTPTGMADWSWTVKAARGGKSQLRIQIEPAVSLQNGVLQVSQDDPQISSFVTNVDIGQSSPQHVAGWISENKAAFGTILTALIGAILFTVRSWKELQNEVHRRSQRA